MTVHQSFSYGVFDTNATSAMGRAFELVCQLKPRASRELIANRIIQLAKAGERSSARLCGTVISELTCPDVKREPFRKAFYD